MVYNTVKRTNVPMKFIYYFTYYATLELENSNITRTNTIKKNKIQHASK